MSAPRGSGGHRARGQTQRRGRGRTYTLHGKDPKAPSPNIQMEHIASVSRSSGLENGGDACV